MGNRRKTTAVFAWVGLFLSAPTITAAQFPAELGGRVTDALSGDPLENVRVEVVGTSQATLTDGRGEFRLRGLEPGRQSVRFSRIGYVALRRDLELRNGQQAWLTVALGAQPVSLEAVRVMADRAPSSGVVFISRAEIEQSRARSAAELLEGRSGLVVVRHGPAGAQSLSIRGSAGNEVLVLLDGAPLNSALTGEADLSTIPTAQIESITVLKGSQSVRHGPGAEAGVILIETRATAAAADARIGAGSLGEWSGDLNWSRRIAGLAWTAGVHARVLDGRFEYSRPAALGGGTATRENADLSERNAFLAATARLAGGQARFRAEYSRLLRGLPGLSFQSAVHAREDLSRWGGQGSLEREWANGHLSAQAYGLEQSARFVDPAPPAGLPYDSRTHALVLGGRLTGELRLRGLLESVSGGVEIRDQRHTSTEFTDSAPGGRFDFGAFIGAEFAPTQLRRGPRVVTAIRIDRDAVARLWRVTHELTGRVALGAVGLYLRHASSYSPPTFGDQFFKEGVAVQPNPNLRAERVPSELGFGATVQGGLWGGTFGRIDLEAFVADVKDMVIWAPDFRFVWSPRNFDVKRRGLDAEAELTFPAQHVELRAAQSLTRVTYDRPGRDDTVQVIYRPRHTGAVAVQWRPGSWHVAVDARFIGTRYPVPAEVNALALFWTVDLRAGRDIRIGAWQLAPVLAVGRLLDNDDSLIYGYPEPGRTLRLDVTLRPR